MTNEEKRKVHKEKRETRMAIFPYLEAERDNILVKELKSAYAKEKEIMKNNPNWVSQEELDNRSKRWIIPESYLNFFRDK